MEAIPMDFIDMHMGLSSVFCQYGEKSGRCKKHYIQFLHYNMENSLGNEIPDQYTKRFSSRQWLPSILKRLKAREIMRQIIVAIETDDPKAHNETYSLPLP